MICFIYLAITIKIAIGNTKTNEKKWNYKVYTCNQYKVTMWCCLVIVGNEGIIPSTANDRPKSLHACLHTNKSYLIIKKVLQSNYFKGELKELKLGTVTITSGS